MTGVTVRMYCGLLGDCFLIRLFSDADADRTGKADQHILIDCGILQGVTAGAARIRAVAQDIRDTCGGKLDLVVVTHEHHDHLCGFGHAADIFLEPGGIDIDMLWLGWTEKEGDDQADALRRQFKQARLAIAGAAHQVRFGIGAAGMNDPQGEDAWHSDGALAGLEGFIGPIEGVLGASSRRTGREILRDLKRVAKGVKCHEPGAVEVTPGGLRAYVLGPPRAPEDLLKDLPTKGEGKETYLALQASLAAAGHATGFGNLGPDGAPQTRLPFNRRHNLLADVDVIDRLQPPGDDATALHRNLWAVRDVYLEAGDRRIDRDWEGAIGSLALKLDSATNNTSLVLALETKADGPILLFAADAQVGNWLSWHKRTYPDASGAPISAKELLERTVLYKVGHHGSHNATLKEQGLEMMKHADLVAMIPVVEAEAEVRPGWHMPFKLMFDDLKIKTKGRILRGDAPVPAGATFSDGSAFEARVRTSKQAGAAEGLWLDYDVC
jgi:hypothetical protein